jgi:hypothetical protein
MKKRDLTDTIGRRDGRTVSRALAANWDWDRLERQEATAVTDTERRQRKVARLAHFGLRLSH